MKTIELTYSDLSKLSGKSFRTIKKRLSDLKPIRKTKRGIFFDSKVALKYLYQKPGEDALDLSAERARLAKLQGDAVEIKNRVSKGNLVESKQVESDALKIGKMIRTGLEGIGNKVAPVLVDLDNPAAIADVINREVNQILIKMAGEIKRFG